MMANPPTPTTTNHPPDDTAALGGVADPLMPPPPTTSGDDADVVMTELEPAKNDAAAISISAADTPAAAAAEASAPMMAGVLSITDSININEAGGNSNTNVELSSQPEAATSSSPSSAKVDIASAPPPSTIIIAPPESVPSTTSSDATLPMTTDTSSALLSSSPPPASAAAVPYSTPPPLFLKLKSGPAYWDSMKSRLILLATTYMSSSSSATLSSSSSSISDPSSSLLAFLTELRDKNYSTLPFDERSRLLSALLPALYQILVSPNGRAATCILTSSSSNAGTNSSTGGGSGGNKEGSKGGAKRPRKKKETAKSSPMAVEKETSTTTTTTSATTTTTTPSAAALTETTTKAPGSSTTASVNPLMKTVPTPTTTTATTTTAGTESKKKRHPSQQGPSPSTPVMIPTPPCHVPPCYCCHSILVGPPPPPPSSSSSSSSSSLVLTPQYSSSPASASASLAAAVGVVHHTIRHTALQLLEQLTLQLLLSSSPTAPTTTTTASSSSSPSSSASYKSPANNNNNNNLSNPSTSFSTHHLNNNNNTTTTSAGIGGGGGGGEATLFRNHAPIITSIAIHVLLEDCEENALLANQRLLVKILRGCTKKTRAAAVQLLPGEGEGGGGGGGALVGGKESVKMQRECQALLDFIVDCYHRLGKKNTNNNDGAGSSTTTSSSSSAAAAAAGVGGGGANKKRKGGRGGGVNSKETTSKMVKLTSSTTTTTMATATIKSSLPTKGGGVVVKSPVNNDMTPQVITSAIGLSIPPSATTNTTTTTISPTAATVVVALPNNSNGCSGIQSYQSFPLLSELPLTVMLLFQLYPIKLASKANMSNLIPAMMAFLQNQSLLTSSPATSSSSSLKTPSALGGAMTPSLSTPLAVVTSSSLGKGRSSTSGKTSANVESSSTQVTGHETASTTTPTTMLQQQQQQQPPSLTVSALTCHVKIVSFITHLLLLPRGNGGGGGGGGNTTTTSPSTPATIASAAAEATLKLYAESCATYVLQLLRFTSSSSSLMLGGVVSSPKTRDGGASSVDGCTVQQQQQSHVIRLRKELLVNTRQLLSTDYRRGFYRHIDAMLDERVLVGSNFNSRLFGGDGGGVVGSSTTATVTHDGLDMDGDGEYLVARVHGGEDQGGDNTVGSGAAVSCSYSSLQPLGYSILAEFVSQVRTKLTPAQLSRTIRIFSRVLHGDLPTSYIYCNGSISTQSMIPTFTTPHSNMQIAAAKLLVHFPEFIFHNRDPNPQVGRDLLFRILRTCVHKLDVVKSWIPTLMNAVENLGNDVQLVDKVDMGKKQVDAMLQGKDTSSALFPLTIIQNLQHVIRPIILGMKTLFWCISSYSHQREKERQRSSLAGEEQFPIPVNYPLTGGSTKFGNNFVNDEVNSGSMKMTIGEREMVEEFIRVGLLCLRIFTVDVHDLLENHLRCDDALYRRRCGYTSSMDVEKRNSNGHREILESFAISFTSLESYNFRKVMAPNLDFMLYQMGIEENNIAMFSHLLLTTGKAVSYEFIEVLMGYLIDNIGGFGEYEREESSNSASVPITNSQASLVTSSVLTKRAQNLFKLLNLCFSSLLKYPRNENAFVPRLQILVRECIQRSMAESPNTRMMNRVGGISENRDLIWPGPYLNTLRALFRTISGGKFDASYKELLPLIPTILNKLYQIYNATYSPPLRHVIIELCLTIPSRLSTLLPHLPLLIKQIIPALNSNTGTLINLSMRTLEFWCDNLHPDYLHPLFATQDNDGVGYCTLMMALTQHLQPAPYPYGLLCMRLLGKLGGVNRLFLREMVVYVDSKGQGEGMETRRASERGNLCMHCEWQRESSSNDAHYDKSFLLPFPLDRAVDVLRSVSAAPTIHVKDNGNSESVSQGSSPLSSTRIDFSDLLAIDSRTLDLNIYSVQTVEEIKNSQAKSAFAVLRAALASVLDIGEDGRNEKISVCSRKGETNDESLNVPTGSEDGGNDQISRQCKIFTHDFKLICDGLFMASVLECIEDEALVLLKGLGSHIFYFLVSHRANITRIDRDGCPIDPYHEQLKGQSKKYEKYNSQNHINEKLQPLKPFGTFRLSGPLEESDIDPLSFNKALADAFAGATVTKTRTTASVVMHHLIELFLRVKSHVEIASDGNRDAQSTVDLHTGDPPIEQVDSPSKLIDASVFEPSTWGDVFFENLLSTLCQACFSQPWNLRSGIMAGMFDLITRMGLSWSAQYEVEILHTAMFIVKDTPDGIAHASEDAARFFFQVSWFFFGGPSSWKESNAIIVDVLCPMMGDNQRIDNSLAVEDTEPVSVKEASITLILSEIASAKPLVRFVVRHVLRLISRDRTSMDTFLSRHTSSLKRLLFPKLLRTLPLPNQCAVVDACAFILDRAPQLIPITDQHLLAFLAELLKMISIADGEFADPSFGSVVLIDKNGVAPNKGGESTSQNRPAMHASSIFLRKGSVIEDSSFGGRIQVPEELPLGVQLRVSTLLLFRGLIRGFPDEFFDADPQSKIGNIRPHVIALLFRSLISEPAEAVESSASALHKALVLGKDTEEESSSSKCHRLSKELIQSCIRPILLNLREHTKLSLPLLRGLSRLLGLLSSWFNKTLGEKLLEHLHNFGEPDKIMRLQVFPPGDEPLIAAAVMDLFALLPQASHFVEALVKQTIRLESALPKYKPCRSISPFRDPLAKYLNRHFASAVGFFLEDHRLCNPVYSNLFRDILRRDDTILIRKYLADNSVMLLNVCFDRPLQIIRSEKPSASDGKPISSSLAVYGINEWNSPSAQRKLEVARQDIEMKKKFLALKSQEEARSQIDLQSKADDTKLIGNRTIVQSNNDAVVRAKRELEEARSSYNKDVSRTGVQSYAPDKLMTVTALELQHQGFQIVETLSSLDAQYLQSQNDVVRALRWLWRSRGRHYRLLHEEEIAPRYHGESMALAKFLVAYSQANPSDTDVLFDLIRIFLHPLSSADFSFIKEFLVKSVSSDATNERKQRRALVLERFSTLLSSEGSEESKILSAQMLVIPLLKQTSQHTVFRDTSLHMLIDSILRDNSHGSKLICELLDIVAILLEHMQAEYMTDYRRNDVLKFIWSVLKNNDAATKYNAYVALARFISIFDAPSNMVTELYQLLLRDNTERNKVRAAIDILLPVLRTKLSNCELEFAQKYTIDMIRDELKVITQMVHLWSTVTRHPDLFCSFKSEIIPLMVQSISFLGLQPNESIDAMRLTVDLAKLVLSWCAVESSSESAGNDQATKLKIAYFDQHSGNIVVNTLIRLAFLAARGRLDHARQRITMNILSVLKGYVSSRQNCDVNSAWFFREIRVQGSNKNDKETSRKSRKVSSNITEGSDGVDAVSLHIGAEIILILLQHDPRNEFLGSNICSLLSRFFAAFANPKEKLHLAHAVEDMLVHLLADGHASNETISYIVVNLEKALRVDTSFNHNSHSNELKRLAVSVIEKVCKTHPYFIESFVCSLVALVESLAKQHTKEATDRASNAMQQMTETGFQHQLAATPTLGTFEIACGLGFKPQSPGNDVQISNGGFKSQVVIVNENISRSLRILISAITLLGSSDSTFTFSTSRRSFIAALGTILDFSCSVPVLMAAVSVIGNWITVDRLKTPLTACERECFLWQLCFLDLQRLPELSSQALGDLIGCIILSVYGYSSSNRWEYPFGTVEPTPTCNVVNQNKRTKGVIHEESFQKLFVSCSLSSNPQIRSVSMGIRSLQLNDCGLVHQKLSNFANEIGCGEGDHLDVAGIPDASKSNILMDVLQLDFESLGKRLWTTVIVDTLLASCKHGAGVRLAHRGSKSLLIQRTGKAPRLLQGYFRLYFENPRSSDYVLDLSNDEHDGGAYSKFTTLLRAQRSENECGRGRCIAAVRNLIQGDADTCQSMLELCLHSVWQSLPDNTARASLIKPLGTLLAQPYHSQHGKSSSHRQINSIQSMLRSIIRLRPMPMIDNVLLLSLGENYSVRNEVLCLLECQYISLKANGYDVDSPSHDLKEAIQQCYESLGDRDMSIAISSLRASLPGTKFALSLDMYDLVNESANAYHALIERAVGDQADFLPTASEIALWEARWVDAHKELGQWSVIEEFASSTGDTNLLLECAWKTNNWEKVSSLCSLPSVGAALEDGDPLTKLTQIYLAIHSENLGEIENLHAQSAQLCLHRWRLLPDIGTARDSHKCLLQQFQRLVELRESSQIMVETSSQSAKGAIPDLKLLLSSWRHRLPNSFERVSEWNDIFLWRLNIFDSISSKFAWTNDQNTIATLHDRPFVCLLLGRASRKQGLMDASAFSLNSLSGGTMEVEYAFLKLREQVVNCREHSLQGGLNLVNSTNLSFFDSRQKAEMFRLKALFYQLSNEKPKANQAFCHAVQMCPTYARTWVDWGRLCASLSDDAATQSGDASECKNLAKKTCLYLVQAMGCFLEAVRCDPSVEQSRDQIPYCLSMLSFDTPLYGNLCRTFETRTAALPSWVWLPWIPQILTSLCRVEARAMKAILVGILKDHPQALYYSLRSFYLERRDIERSVGHKAAPSNSEDDALTSSRLAEEFMSNLRKAHPVLWSKLESILEDLIVRFRPSYEAELLNSMVALLQKTTNTAAQLESCKKTLRMLGTKFFNLNKEKNESSGSGTRALFHAKYASLFKNDFLADEEDGWDAIVAKLQKWRQMLERGMSRVPTTSTLQEVSPLLSWFSAQPPDLWAGACESKSLVASNAQHDAYNTLDNALYRAKRSSALAATKASSQAVLSAANVEGLSGHSGGGAAAVEIPGQYAPTSSNALDSRPFPELHAKLARFHQSIELTNSSTNQYVHQITMIGSDGKAYKFKIQLAIPYWIRTDERSAQIQYVVGKTLRRDFRACRRCLSTRPSIVIPIAQRMRMSAIQSSHDSLDAVFCHVQGTKSSSLMSYFEEKVTESAALSGIDGQDDAMQATNNSAMNKIKLEVFQDICETQVPPNVLSRYMSEMISSIEHLYRFRQVFAAQLAINSLLQYAFAIVERTPNKFAFCNITGQVLSPDFRSQYKHGSLERLHVPFRMTRSITEFIGPFMLEGVLIPSFAITSSALHSQKRILKPILHLLMRDDVMSWYTSKSSAKNDQKLQEVEGQLSDQIWKNVRFVQECFKECSPREVEDAAAEAMSENPDPIDARVRSLIDAATSAEKLSLMPVEYHPWL